jgi:hypothetical protein
VNILSKYLCKCQESYDIIKPPREANDSGFDLAIDNFPLRGLEDLETRKGNMNRLRYLVFILWTFLAVWLPEARSHDLNMTGIKVRLDADRTTVSVVAHLHALNYADPSSDLAQRLRLRLDEKPFAPDKMELLQDTANGIVIWQGHSRISASRVAIDAPIFPEKPTEKTVVTVFKDRQLLDEAVLDANHSEATLGVTTDDDSEVNTSRVNTSNTQVGLRFLHEGIRHILLGWDHVIFVVSLLLLGGTWKQLLKILTTFTLAHSITLSLAALGLVSLSPRFVEPVIALSIIAVAAANLLAPQRTRTLDTAGAANEGHNGVDFRPALAFGFGLIHGFGFVGVLAEIGLPHEALGWALVSFNLGVELGQAAIVLIVAPLLARVISSWPRLQHPIVFCGSTAVAMIAAFWFTQRVFTA